MAGEAAVSDPIGLALAWAASGLDRGGGRGRRSRGRLRDEQSATPWDCSSAAALPSRSLAIRSRDGAAHLFT
ncbi:hypothetical protein BANRA_05267 [Klebsiella pneumoniae]|nr:hypothetical protein BANRA_05267 [Klebsiella pneumoniae]